MSWDSFVIVGDTHGDMIDLKARKAFLAFCDDFKPQKRIHLGDAIDFRAWRRGASSADQADSMQQDYDAGMKFLRDFQPDVWLLGNHDHRLWMTAEDGRGPMRDYATSIIRDIEDVTAALGCRVIPWGVRKGVYELGTVRNGGYNVHHGYRTGIQAIVAESRCWGRSISGHIHAPGTYVDPAHEARIAHTIGCLCKLDMPYSLGNEGSLRQEHAWGMGWEDTKTGAVEFRHVRKIGKEWMYSDTIKGVR